ncbi:SDR family NAD(P)-dependent oxidoreductase [Bifidobacterium imperatoris]|uniref:SDR family NAD(P)-dependent oxidoreductase n=1 Tax=Bifidobacterium imperatoris TaxID=2020965 RepID=A0A2N5IV31_9BIFI|nr:SDR family NAD(P)-dependent oxidoreductase [Bifidobacterium imperatoris]PLS25798.1 SDR family oxidoreductase [Bifidobacterium imperatoris]QSY57902.1 SDR family NAD(P)-dependent oxidoreductase [Bifidobacterium imperatoris]
MQIALITGSGRKGGLGYETARQLGEAGYHVILAARRPELAQLTQELIEQDISASYVVMDTTDEASVKAAAAEVNRRFGRLDVLINNAASMRAGDSVEQQDLTKMRMVFDTNVIGTWNVTQKFIPLLRKSEHGRIVNVSSGAGSYGDPQYGFLHGNMGIPASGYGISKLALNGLTIKTAKELAADHILVNAVCPDLTDSFGSGMFGRPVEISAKSVTWAATLPDDGPTGGFFRDGQPLPW